MTRRTPKNPVIAVRKKKKSTKNAKKATLIWIALKVVPLSFNQQRPCLKSGLDVQPCEG